MITDENVKNPVEVIELMLERFIEQKDRFEQFLPEQKDIGMLRIRIKDVKSSLTPSPQRGFDEIKTLLPPVIKQRTEESIDWLSKQIESISGKINSVNDFVKQAQALEYIDNHFQTYKDKIGVCQNILASLIGKNIDVSKEEKKLIEDKSYQYVTLLNNAIMTATEMADRNRDSIKKKINESIPLLNKDVEKLTEDLEDPKYLDINSNIYDMLRDVDFIEERTKKIVETAK